MRGGKNVAETTDRSAVLYAAFLGGDQSALEQLVMMHGDALTRFAYCIVRNDAAAEDVMADTFATLIVRRKKIPRGRQVPHLAVYRRAQQGDRLCAQIRQTALAFGS